jgi:hypothetical protein
MLKGYHTAENIIKEALVEFRDVELINYKEAGMYFLKGYRDFQLFEAGAQIKEDWRPLTPINTVNFPEDLLRLISVGVTVDGEFFSFTRTDKMRIPSDPLDKELDSTRGEDTEISRSPSFGYGTKAQNLEYYYKEDRERRRIILNRIAIDKTLFADRSEVMVKYVSTGIEDFKTTYIADDAANLLSSYVLYKLIFARPDLHSQGYIAMRRQDYIEQLTMYRALELPSLDDLENMIYETSGQNVRRG